MIVKLEGVGPALCSHCGIVAPCGLFTTDPPTGRLFICNDCLNQLSSHVLDKTTPAMIDALWSIADAMAKEGRKWSPS